jgi:hypothetical protein
VRFFQGRAVQLPTTEEAAVLLLPISGQHYTKCIFSLKIDKKYLLRNDNIYEA